MVYITPTFPPQCHCDAGSGKSCDPAKECKQGMQLPGIRKTVCITDTLCTFCTVYTHAGTKIAGLNGHSELPYSPEVYSISCKSYNQLHIQARR